MLTSEKLKIYSHYKGDVDMWARIGRRKEKQIMTDDDWLIIDSILQDIRLVNSKLASKEYAEEVERKLEQYSTDVQTMEALKKIAKENW